MRPSSLSRLDWDFTAVPDDELFGCCLWEYARESNFIRRTLHSYREWFLSGGQRSEESERLFAATDRIQSIGDISEVIIRGCSFASNVAWQSKDESAPNFRHPDADPITGSFPAAWQNLSLEERKCRARMAKCGKRLVAPPIERGITTKRRTSANTIGPEPRIYSLPIAKFKRTTRAKAKFNSLKKES